MRGRYTPYTPQLAAEICARIAAGQTLTTVSEQPGMPSRSSLVAWLRERPEFRDAYKAAVRARTGPPVRRPRGSGPARGQGTRMTPEMEAEILERLAAGESLRQIGADRRLPCVDAILRRVRRDAEFRRRYQVSCEEREEMLLETAMLIAADETGDLARDKLVIEVIKVRLHRLALKENAGRPDDPPEARLSYWERVKLLA